MSLPMIPQPLRAAIAAVAVLMLFTAKPALACTVVVVGKNVTADGSVMVAHGDDGATFTADLRLIKVRAPRRAAPLAHHKCEQL